MHSRRRDLSRFVGTSAVVDRHMPRPDRAEAGLRDAGVHLRVVPKVRGVRGVAAERSQRITGDEETYGPVQSSCAGTPTWKGTEP